MYVRWKRYTRKPRGYGRSSTPEWLLVATLVESRRVDGRVKQTQVAYLGSIRESHLETPYARDRFHRDAWNVLNEAVTDSDMHARLWMALVARVPVPTDDEREAAEKEFERNVHRMKYLASELDITLPEYPC